VREVGSGVIVGWIGVRYKDGGYGGMGAWGHGGMEVWR